MRCADVMRRDIQCLHQEADARSAARLMEELGASFLPVCDARDRLVGSVSAFDLATRVCSGPGRPSGCRVLDIMETRIVACRPDDDVAVANELMGEYGEGRVFVVNEDDVVQGIITPDELGVGARPQPSA